MEHTTKYFYIRNEINHPVTLVGYTRKDDLVVYAFATCNPDYDKFTKVEAHDKVDKRLKGLMIAAAHDRFVDGHVVSSGETGDLLDGERETLDASGLSEPTVVERIMIDIARKGRQDVPTRTKTAARYWLRNRLN